MNKTKVGGVHLTSLEITNVLKVAQIFNWTKPKGIPFDLTKILRGLPDLFHFVISVLILCFYLLAVLACLIQKVVFFQDMTKELEYTLDCTAKKLDQTQKELRIKIKKQIHLVRSIAALKRVSKYKLREWEDLTTFGKKSRRNELND